MTQMPGFRNLSPGYQTKGQTFRKYKGPYYDGTVNFQGLTFESRFLHQGNEGDTVSSGHSDNLVRSRMCKAPWNCALRHCTNCVISEDTGST